MTATDPSQEVILGRMSVVVPTKESADTIVRCLSSIRSQSYRDVEIIVVDNGSDDGTAELARGYADRVVIRGPERSRQRNAGAEASSGEYLMFVDSDMMLSAEVAEEAVRTFREDPEAEALVIPETSIGQGFWARCRALEKELYLGDPTVEAARIFRRSAFVEADGYDERIHGGGEDWDLPERIASRGGGIGRIRAECIHDESRLRLAGNLRKKLYYGRTLGRYASRHPRSALRKVIRTTYLRNLPRLVRDPVTGTGLLFMKAAELAAVAAGMIASVFIPHPADRTDPIPAARHATIGNRNNSSQAQENGDPPSIVSDMFATRATFRNWIEVGVLGGLAVPSRLPPRRGWPRIAGRRLKFRTRLGPVLETELGNASPIIEVFRNQEYEAPFDWTSLESVVDVGAHVGAFVCWVAQRSPRARFVAFEPEPRNFQDLVRNVRNNGLEERVIARQEAAGATTDQRTLVVPVGRERASYVVTGLAGARVTVTCRDFNRFVREECQRPISLLKMDCEGAEWEILASLSPVAWNRIERILVEFHTMNTHDLSDMERLIRAQGFSEWWVLKTQTGPSGLGSLVTVGAQRGP